MKKPRQPTKNPKMFKCGKVGKRFKMSWIDHGAWMGIAHGYMEDGCMGPKHSSQNFTCLGGQYVSGGLNYPNIKNAC